MALTNFKAFDDIVEKVFEANATSYHEQLVAELGGKIAGKTPVDTGTAKYNWHADESDDVKSLRGTDQTKTGLRVKRRILKDIEIGKANIKRVLYLKNGVDSNDRDAAMGIKEARSKNKIEGGYIIQLESGELSPQAPNGMVYVTLADLERISKKARKQIVTKAYTL